MRETLARMLFTETSKLRREEEEERSFHCTTKIYGGQLSESVFPIRSECKGGFKRGGGFT